MEIIGNFDQDLILKPEATKLSDFINVFIEQIQFILRNIQNYQVLIAQKQVINFRKFSCFYVVIVPPFATDGCEIARKHQLF